MARRIYYAGKDNGASVPWEMDNEWVFTATLDWQSWLLGISRHGDSYSAVWSLHIGPIALTYYHRN